MAKINKTIKKKLIKARMERECAICGHKMKIILHTDKTYRGGKYFFKIPISTKKEQKRAASYGTREEKWGDLTVRVMKRDPKPYKLVEYWECANCFYRRK